MNAAPQFRRTAADLGCIKLGLPRRGQLVTGTTGLGFRGQAVPAPFTKALRPELDAALAAEGLLGLPLA